MKKITTLAILGASLIGLAACSGSSKSKVEETKPVTAKHRAKRSSGYQRHRYNKSGTTSKRKLSRQR